MPEMDGFEILERYRASSHARARIPVIVWTAKDLTAAEQARLGHEVVRVVSKREGGARSFLDALDAVLRPA